MKLAAPTFIFSCLLAIALTAWVRRWATRKGLLDLPAKGRLHKRAVPRVGGLGIAAPVLGLLFAWAVVRQWPTLDTTVLPLLGGGLVILAAGLIDDLRGLRAGQKFAAQLLAAVLCASAGRIETLDLPGLVHLELGPCSWPLTVLWLVAAANAINFVDGIDGLASGISAIASAIVLTVAIITGQVLTALLAAAILGATVGFLVFNFPPARIFMGDCGSMFLGLMLAALAVRCSQAACSTKGLLLPALAMGVPILDMALSVVRRVQGRRAFFRPDYGHVHHQFLRGGLSHCQALVRICGGTAAAAVLGLAIVRARGLDILVIAGGSMLILLWVFLGAQRRCAETIDPQSHEVMDLWTLAFREARDFEAWWATLCQAAHRLGFVRLSMCVTNRDGSIRQLVWQSDPAASPDPLRLFVVRAEQSRPGPPLDIETFLPLGQSLQKAAAQASMLNDLVKRHSVADLPRTAVGAA